MSDVEAGVVLDLAAIEAALIDVAHAALAADLGRERPSADLIRRLVSGYAYVDELLVAGADPLALGGSHHLVELNHRVLCGVTPARREQFREHIRATEARFYDDHAAGADALYAWVERARPRPVTAFVARLVVHLVSAPQPFLEGNQRTASLVASLLLARAGLPPLVLTRTNLPTVRPALQAAKALDRRSWTALWQLPAMERRLRPLLEGALEPGFLHRRSDGATGVSPPHDAPAAAVAPRAR